MKKSYKLCVPRGTGGRTLPPIPLAGRIELLARIRVRHETPAASVVHEICDRFDVPRRAANCVSGYHTGVERLLAEGNAEAIRLAREWDLPIKEIADGDEHLGGDTDDGAAGDHHLIDGDDHLVDDHDIDELFNAHGGEFTDHDYGGQGVDLDDDIALDGYRAGDHDDDRDDAADGQECDRTGKVGGDGNSQEVMTAT